MTLVLATDLAVFAQERGAVQVRREKELLGSTLWALRHFGQRNWYRALLAHVEKVVRQQYHEDTGKWTSVRLREAQSTLRKQAQAMLDKTSEPTQDHLHDQALLIARSLSVSAVNLAITVAGQDSPETGLYKTWISMEDSKVRPTHAEAHGQTVRLNELFEVGTSTMSRPGDLRAPIEEWVNCRCILAVVAYVDAVAASLSAAATKTPGGDMPTDIDEIDEIDEIDALEQELGEAVPPEEVPWFGVLAPEDVLSGDNRKFAAEALTWRDLPLPLKWQPTDQPGHEGSVIVGRIDDIWRDGNLLRARGMFIDNEDASNAIGLLAQGALRGVSIDADKGVMEMQTKDGSRVEDLMEAMKPGDELELSMDDLVEVYTEGRISSATLCAIPAFAEAFVSLGMEESVDSDGVALAASAMVEAAIDEGPWDGSASRYTDEQWFRATIIHLNGDSRVKSDNKLPVYTPGGALSRAGVHAAAGRLNQVDAPAEKISSAKATLRGLYEKLGEDAPDSLTAAAVFVPGTQDGPGWLTHPVDTDRLRDYWVHGKGALKIGWGVPGDFNRCRAHLAKYVKPMYLNGYCANRHKDALGFWPGEHRGGRHSADTPVLNLVSSASLYAPPIAWFSNPGLVGPSPVVVTEEGRIFGHLATWGTCHIGIRGACVTPPVSASDYAYFRTGSILTEEGEEIAIGSLTMGTGHADIGLRSKAAMAHYDNTGTACADVRVGEDEHGIWVAGAIRPELDEAKIRALRAGAISGDWREIGGNLELVAGLIVNVPGFPIPRVALAASGGHQTALVAAGMVLTAAGDHLPVASVEEIVTKTIEAMAARAAAQARMRELATARASGEKAKMDALAAQVNR